METLFSFRASSPVGPLFLAASTKGLVRLEFEARVQNLPKTTQIQESKKVLAPYLRQLSEYFAGDRASSPFRSIFAEPISTSLLARPDRNSLRRNAQLPRNRTSHRTRARLPRGRHVEQPEPRRYRRSLPPCNRVEWLPVRIRGGLDIKRKLLDLEQGGIRLQRCLPLGIGA